MPAVEITSHTAVVEIAASPADSMLSSKTPVPLTITPLVGSWADECWGSRQASEIIIDAVGDKKLFNYDYATTNVYDEEEEDVMQETQSMVCHASEPVSPQWSGAAFPQTASNCYEPHQEEEPMMVAYPSTHVARCISYNSCDLSDPCVLHYYCECAECVALHQRETDEMYAVAAVPQPQTFNHPQQQQHVAYNVSPTIAPAAAPRSTYSHAPMDVPRRQPHQIVPVAPSPLRPTSSNDSPMSHQAKQQQQQPATNSPSSGPFVTHSNRKSAAMAGYFPEETYYEEPAQPAFVHNTTPFMPPPPPPTVMPNIMYEEGNNYADSIFFHVMQRWYNKVAQLQHAWVPENELCPVMPTLHDGFEPFTFSEWCEMVATWWFAHFEHLQKKSRFVPAPSRYYPNQY